MHLIQSFKNEFCFDLPLFSEYPATSINSYFHKMTLHVYQRYKKRKSLLMQQKWMLSEHLVITAVVVSSRDSRPNPNLARKLCYMELEFLNWLKWTDKRNFLGRPLSTKAKWSFNVVVFFYPAVIGCYLSWKYLQN